MDVKQHPSFTITEELLESLRGFPVGREVEHCGVRFTVSPFDIYAECPQCSTRLKVRSFSGAAEIEDMFDAVFEWLNQPQAQDVARERQAVLAEEEP